MVDHLLSLAAIKIIEAEVAKLFDRARVRFLGPQVLPKRIHIVHSMVHTLPGLFISASREEGAVPDQDILRRLIHNAGNYMDAYEAKAKAEVVRRVQAFLQEAEFRGVTTDLPTVLGGQLAEVWGKTTRDIRRLVDTEATVARNMGALDGIIAVNTAEGVEDPLVYWVVVRDEHLCAECHRLHLLDDGTTPRVYHLSEVGHGYHKRGQPDPKVGGLHPNCRCLYDRNAPVITESGTKPLHEVKVGDRVLTHTGKFKSVLSTFSEEGKVPAPDDVLYRVEFTSPQGTTHSLRMTADHLMSTGRGWVRADGLRPGEDTLQYLFKDCEACGHPFPHNIKKPGTRFCSAPCVGVGKVGKPGPTLGRKQPQEERERRRVGLNSSGGYSFRPVTIDRVVCVPRAKMSKGARLYDITVEDDESFVVSGVVSHNCTMVTLLPGYGFNTDGTVTFRDLEHDEFRAQRGH
jgi:hypothetical protein